jgi:hypothetical protein
MQCHRCHVSRRVFLDVKQLPFSRLLYLPLSPSLSEKLNRENLLVWQAQILSEISGAQLFGLLDGSLLAPDKEVKFTNKDGKEISVPNPKYAS